jgi:hypothetical protein
MLLGTSLAILLSLLGVACLVVTVLGMPGNWGMVAMAILSAWLIEPSWRSHLPWSWVVTLLILALLGELVEFLASAAGVGKLGGSKRSAVLAIAGSMIGAIIGLFVGIPIPVVGGLIASVVLGGVGAGIGAALGERWAGRQWEGSLKIASAAFWGRMLGTVGKSAVGAVMTVVFLVGCWT